MHIRLGFPIGESKITISSLLFISIIHSYLHEDVQRSGMRRPLHGAADADQAGLPKLYRHPELPYKGSFLHRALFAGDI